LFYLLFNFLVACQRADISPRLSLTGIILGFIIVRVSRSVNMSPSEFQLCSIKPNFFQKPAALYAFIAPPGTNLNPPIYLHVNRKACRAKKGAIERGFAPLLLYPLPLLRG